MFSAELEQWFTRLSSRWVGLHTTNIEQATEFWREHLRVDTQAMDYPECVGASKTFGMTPEWAMIAMIMKHAPSTSGAWMWMREYLKSVNMVLSIELNRPSSNLSTWSTQIAKKATTKHNHNYPSSPDVPVWLKDLWASCISARLSAEDDSAPETPWFVVCFIKLKPLMALLDVLQSVTSEPATHARGNNTGRA